MKLLIVSGSRSPEGQTANALLAFAKGVKVHNWEVSIEYLPSKHIERCRQCDPDGWGICRGGERCIIDDDFAALMEAIRNADVVVFGTPVYFSDLSESLRAFLDRFRRVSIHSARRDRIEGKPVIGICVAGGGGGGAPRCVHQLDYIVSTCGMNVIDMVPVRRQNLATKLEALELLGDKIADLLSTAT